MCVGLVLLVFAILLLRWCCLDRENEWIVQHGARYLNGGYWAAGLRGGGGRFNIARIALKWRKADTTREENLERTEDAEKIAETTDIDKQIRSKKEPGRSQLLASNSLTAIGTIVGLCKMPMYLTYKLRLK